MHGPWLEVQKWLFIREVENVDVFPNEGGERPFRLSCPIGYKYGT